MNDLYEEVAAMTAFEKHKLHEIVLAILKGGDTNPDNEDIVVLRSYKIFKIIWMAGSYGNQKNRNSRRDT